MLPATLPRHSALARGNRDLLHLLGGLAAYHRATYCWPAYDTVQRLYGQLYGRSISARTLCRHFRRLEAEGLITRQRRHYRDKAGQLILRSTLYRLTTYAARLIRSTINRVRQVLDYFAVTKMAKHPDPLSVDLPPEKERAPDNTGGARDSSGQSVDKSVDKSAGRQAIADMRRQLAGATRPRRR